MTSVPLGPGPEFDRIRAAALALGSRARGLGDDCAFLQCGPTTLCVSIDGAIEGIHFDRRWLDPEEIGWRAAAAALSDLAACGAGVEGLLVALSVPRSEPASLVVALMGGVGAAVAAAGGQVLGGDLSGGDRISLAVTVIGRADRPVGRAGARPGDGLWVSGTLGGARAALRAWQRGRVPDPEARLRFARPEPRIALGAWLAARGASAMLDLSDGLASDARHLARAGNVGLEVDLGLVPIGPGVGEAAEGDGQSAGEFAARGGEDYELLVTLPAEARMEDPPGGTPLSRIGRVIVGSGVTFVRDGGSLELEGFDHFA